MSFHGHPGTKGGVYRLKVYNSERDLYWKYVPDSQRIQLATVDKSESPGLLFKWHISPNKSSTAFTIRPAYNPDFALDRDQNGNPKAKKGRSESSLDWVITQGDLENSCSTIKFDDDNNLEVLGCSNPATDPLIDFELFVESTESTRLALYSPAFGYGSNIWDEQMKKRCPDHVYNCIARLDGWKWIINTRGVATIIPSPNDHVWGTVLLLHAHDEQKLDRAEGPNYVKSILAVHLDGVKVIPGAVLTYIDKNTTPGRPRKTYVNKLEKAMADGKAKGIPQAYFDKYWKPFLTTPFVGSKAAEAELEE
ncbi:hypothetical protein BYT27DRAFT_7249482 [Phlegmacium glaucopus]|nr:hypothetical protein BYT27DRAFT_7249482 [Phlegmacium glaucopus]